MSGPYVLVWRQIDGGAVSTFSTEGKKPRAFSDASAETAPEVSENELQKLISSRAPFEAKRVPLDLAERLLGWTVPATAE